MSRRALRRRAVVAFFRRNLRAAEPILDLPTNVRARLYRRPIARTCGWLALTLIGRVFAPERARRLNTPRRHRERGDDPGRDVPLALAVAEAAG